MSRGRSVYVAVAVAVAAAAGGTAAGASSPAVAGGPFAACAEAFTAQDTAETWGCCDCYYQVARREGLWQEAAVHLEAHLEAEPDHAWARFYLGRVALDGGRGDAGDQFRRAAARFAAIGEALGEAYSQLNLYRHLAGQERLDEGLTALESATAAATVAGDDALRAEIEVQRVGLLGRLGSDAVEVAALLREIEPLAAAAGSYYVRRDLLLMQGQAAFELGRYARARRFYERLAVLSLEAGDPFAEAVARLDLALAFLAAESSAEARDEGVELVRGALDVAVAAGHRRVEAQARLALGRLLPGEEGLAELERSAAMAGDLATPATMRALGVLATRVVATDPERAESLLESAAEALAASPDPRAAVYGWHERVQVRWATRPRSEALAAAFAELDDIEALRDQQNAEGGRTEVFAVWTEAYYWLAGKLFEAAIVEDDREAVERAHEVAERLRARVLLDALAGDPRGADLAPWSGLASLGEVEAALAADQALLAFLVADDENVYGDSAGGAWLLAATRTGSRVYRLPGRARLRAAVDVALGLVARRDESVERAAAVLHDELLAAALSELPHAIEELVLVPDGELHLLPFGALRPTPSAPALAERYRLTVVPSATLWRHWQQADDGADHPRAVAFVDPAVPAAGETVGSTRMPGPRQLGRLPFARREGRSLSRRLGRLSTLRIGDEATEARLAADLASAGLVHFAAHAVVDEDSPQRSTILLAAGGDEDGRLEAAEIAGLDFDDRIVVLSACRSAGGNVLRGEGVLSLARAFFQAGARTVVGSLWPLRDDDAAHLFDPFYRHLAGGESVAGALAAAQRERIAAAAPAAAWAGLVVFGDGRATPFPGGRPRSSVPGLAWLAALAFVGAVGVWLYRRRRGAGWAVR